MCKTDIRTTVKKGDKVKIKDFDELWLVDRIVNTAYWAYNDWDLLFEGQLAEIEEVHKVEGTIIILSEEDHNYISKVDSTEVDWEEELPNIYEMIQNFASKAAIARKYGVSKQRLGKVLKGFGITTKSKTQYFKEIADAVGCSPITVRDHINGSHPAGKLGKEIDKYIKRDRNDK